MRPPPYRIPSLTRMRWFSASSNACRRGVILRKSQFLETDSGDRSGDNWSDFSNSAYPLQHSVFKPVWSKYSNEHVTQPHSSSTEAFHEGALGTQTLRPLSQLHFPMWEGYGVGGGEGRHSRHATQSCASLSPSYQRVRCDRIFDPVQYRIFSTKSDSSPLVAYPLFNHALLNNA